jgi:hypothetical protein
MWMEVVTTPRLQAGDAPAAVLTAIGNFLHRSGTKAANDSPAMKRLTASYEALPFLSDDSSRANDTLGPTGPATLPNHSASAPKDQL